MKLNRQHATKMVKHLYFFLDLSNEIAAFTALAVRTTDLRRLDPSSRRRIASDAARAANERRRLNQLRPPMQRHFSGVRDGVEWDVNASARAPWAA